jgi:hypothetical protein
MKTQTVFKSKLDGLVEKLFLWLDDNLFSQELWMIIPLPERLTRTILKRRLIESDLADKYPELFEDDKKQ